MNTVAPQPAKSYIATENFTNYFRTYSVIEGNGIWGQVTTDESLCPVGRILRENGRRLFPKANPGVNQLYIGVYDAKTFLSGFIDPNQRVFQVFNGDKPNYLNDNDSDDGDSNDGTEPDYGEPVYTRGNITTTDGDITVETGDVYVEGQNDSGGSVYCFGGSNSAVYAGYSPDGGPPVGNVMAFTNFDAPFVASFNFGNAAVLSGYDGSIYTSGLYYPYNAVGTSSALTPNGVINASSGPISNDLITDPAPYIMLTRFTAGGTLGHLSYTVNTTDHTFTIISDNYTDTSTVNWLLIGNGEGSPFFTPFASPAAASFTARAATTKPKDGKKFNPSTLFNLGRRHR